MKRTNLFKRTASALICSVLVFSLSFSVFADDDIAADGGEAVQQAAEEQSLPETPEVTEELPAAAEEIQPEAQPGSETDPDVQPDTTSPAQPEQEAGAQSEENTDMHSGEGPGVQSDDDSDAGADTESSSDKEYDVISDNDSNTPAEDSGAAAPIEDVKSDAGDQNVTDTSEKQGRDDVTDATGSTEKTAEGIKKDRADQENESVAESGSKTEESAAPEEEVKDAAEEAIPIHLFAPSFDNSTRLPDGEYTSSDFEFIFEGGSGRVKYTLDKIVVSNGKATGFFTGSSDTLTHVYYLGRVDEVTTPENNQLYNPDTGECGEGVLPFVNRKVSFPVKLNQKTGITGRTSAMSPQSRWIPYYYTIVIDESEKEIISNLTVDSNVEGLSISSSSLGTMSQSGKMNLHITPADNTFTKLFFGNAAQAQEDGAVLIDLSANKESVFGFSAAGKKLSIALYDPKTDIWHDATLQVNNDKTTLTLREGKKADYSKVDAAKKKVPSDLSVYKASRVKALENALNAVKEGLYASEQAKVDGWAKDINSAVAGLEKEKLTIKIKAVDKETGNTIKKAVITVKDKNGRTVEPEKAGVYSLGDEKYDITVTAKNYEKAERKNYKPVLEETLTFELEPKEVIPPGTTIFKEDEADPSKTNLFNTTGMFKVIKGVLVNNKDKRTLTVTMSGQGYHNMFKGIYEDALANGFNKDNWIRGVQNSEGFWEFTFELGKSETYIPVVAISQTHLEKAEMGEEDLSDAIFARQMELDLDKMTLTTGDYDAIVDIRVESLTERFKVEPDSIMEVVGGPNSNNYACKPVINMADGLYSKAFIGTAENAVKDGAVILGAGPASFKFEFINYFGENGRVVMFEDKKPIAVAFYNTEKQKWEDYKLTIDKAASKVTLEALKEDEVPPEPPAPKPDEEKEEYQDASNTGTSAVNSSTGLADGTYTPDSFSFSGGTGKVVIVCDSIEVRNGQTYATLRFMKSSGGPASVDRLRANGQEYPGNNTFTIPVELNKNNTIVARTTAMSQPHWIEYTIFIALAAAGDAKKGNDVSENTTSMDEEAPDILGLKATGETETAYSDLVKIFNYEDGYYLIELDAVKDTARDTLEYRTKMKYDELTEDDNKKAEEAAEKKEAEETADEEEGSSNVESISEKISKLYENEIIKYLVIPDGKEVPAGMDKEVIIIKQPADKSYVSSEKALELIDQIGAAGNVTTVGLEKSDIAKDAVYAGPYEKWDLRTMIKEKTNLAVESSEILPSDEKTLEKDMDNLVRLGQRSAQMNIAMFIDRCTDEKNELAAAEWLKVYGVIYNVTDTADTLYKNIVDNASDKDKKKAKDLLETRAKEKKELTDKAAKAAEEQLKEEKK